MVLSGSMEPGYWRGDILFLHMGRKPLRAGEVVVFNLKERDIPIVHRIIKVHEEESGEIVVLTKVSMSVVWTSMFQFSTDVYSWQRALSVH